MSLDAVLGQARVHPEVRTGIRDDVEQADDEPVVGLGGRHLPAGDDAGLPVLLVGVDLGEPGGRTHPVQRFVGATVGVDENRAVRLDHDEASGPGQMGVQAPGVVHAAGGNDDAHAGSLQASGGSERANARARPERANATNRLLGRPAPAPSGGAGAHAPPVGLPGRSSPTHRRAG